MKNQSNITIEQAQAMKKKLRRGDLTLLANTLKISRVAVYYAISGVTQNSGYILEALQVLANQREMERKQLLQSLQHS